MTNPYMPSPDSQNQNSPESNGGPAQMPYGQPTVESNPYEQQSVPPMPSEQSTNPYMQPTVEQTNPYAQQYPTTEQYTQPIADPYAAAQAPAPAPAYNPYEQQAPVDPAAAPAPNMYAQVPPQPTAQTTNMYGQPPAYGAQPMQDPMYGGVPQPYDPAYNYTQMPQMQQGVAGEVPQNLPWYGIDFLNAIKRFFTKYATFSGRASRSEFWWAYLMLFVVNLLFTWLGEAASFFNTLGSIWSLAVLIPTLAVSARRLHDSNLSAAWLFLPYGLSVVGAIVMVIGVFSGVLGAASQLSTSATISTASLASMGVGALIGAIMILAGVISLIVLMVRQSNPEGARFDAPQYQ